MSPTSVVGLRGVPVLVCEDCPVSPLKCVLCSGVMESNPYFIGSNQALDKVVLLLRCNAGQVIVALALALVPGTVPAYGRVEELVTFASEV